MATSNAPPEGLACGRIVYVRKGVLDPQGGNPKETRPLVVITKNEDIQPEKPIHVVAITDAGNQIPRSETVSLPWRPFGRGVMTRLSKESVAWCKWVVEIDHSQIQELGGWVSGKKLEEIRKKVAMLSPPAPPEAK